MWRHQRNALLNSGLVERNLDDLNAHRRWCETLTNNKVDEEATVTVFIKQTALTTTRHWLEILAV